MKSMTPKRLLCRRLGGVARLPCRQRSGIWAFPMSSMSIDAECPRQSEVLSMQLDGLCVPSLGRHAIVARNVYYVDVWAVWRVSRVVSGIRTDTVSDEQPHVDRRGMSETERSPFHVTRGLCVPSLGRHAIVARNVYYVDVRAVSCVISGIRADTVIDVQPHVDRRGFWRVSRGTALLLHHLARIKGPGRRYTEEVRVELTTGSPLAFHVG